MLRRHFVCCLLPLVILSLVSSSRAGEFNAERLKDLRPRMQKYVETGIVPGAVAAIGGPDGIVALEAVGARSLGESQPMTRQSLFRIASMTKPITALGIMLLVDEGKLQVTDPVEKYLPEFKGQQLVLSREGNQAKLGPPERPITLQDLLTHTSGLPGGFPPPHNDLYFKRDLTLAEAVGISAKLPLDFAPGSKWAYCNAGIDTLGRIIEVVSGKSYEDFLKQRIFEPLAMHDTTFYPSDEQLARLATLYDRKDNKLVDVGYVLLGPTKQAKHPVPAGGLYSTADDLGKLYQMMLRHGTIGNRRIVSEASLHAMTQVQTGKLECGFTPGMSFGYGWAVVREPQGVHAMMSPGTYGHGGAFGTQGWIDPEKQIFVILLIQRTGLPNADASDLRRDLQDVAVSALQLQTK